MRGKEERGIKVGVGEGKGCREKEGREEGREREEWVREKQKCDFPQNVCGVHKVNFCPFQEMLLVIFSAIGATFYSYTFSQIDIPLPKDIVRS